MFAGSDRGADRAAAIATLIMTAKFNDVDAANLRPPDHARIRLTTSRLTTAIDAERLLGVLDQAIGWCALDEAAGNRVLGALGRFKLGNCHHLACEPYRLCRRGNPGSAHRTAAIVAGSGSQQRTTVF